MTFSFSEVSKSTSYEAAKDAWNKANNAQNTADSKPDMSDVGDYVASRGENLVTNGTCLLGDNTNFSSFTYDGSDTYYAGGSFKISSTSTSGNIVVCDEFIPVDTASKYLFSYWIKTSNALARYYDFIASYDIDKKSIYAAHVMWIAGSTTTLAKELKNGDTVIYLTSAAGFNTTTTNDYQKGLIFWNYKNSKGYTYGPETYSQNRWESLWGDGSAIDKSNNTITLKTAWTHGTFPAGTSVSQCNDGGSYTYLNSDFTLPAANTWIHKTGTVCGVGKNDASGKFREGTAFVKVGWITNRDVSSGATCWLSTISLTQNVGLADVIKSVDVEYYLSTSATSLSGGSWSTTAPTWVDGKYMWSRTVTVDGTGSKTYSPNQNGVCIAGAKGSTGAAGKGVTSIVEQYYKSTSATSLTGGSWSTTYPGWENGKYIWTRSVITYTDKTTSITTAVCVTGAKGDKGATGAMGETLSNGKLLYKDVMFAEGNNGISSYNNSSGGAVTLVRQAKSSDNPCGDYELVITNTGAASPGIGGFKWAHATRANAVFIYRIIAKIPTDRALRWMSNSAGDVTSGKFLTSNSGTGKFTEYIYKFTCGASGTFGTTGCFYINGSAGSSSSPVKWYVAYAGVWDMTDYEDMLPKDEAKDIYTTQLEMSKTNSELRLDFTKSIASASDDMQSKLDAANDATDQKFGEISKYIRFVDGKIVLGETGSELTLTVQNDRVSFQQDGNEVAYFSNNNLYIRRAEVLTTLKVGNYEFAPRNHGGLVLRKRGN
jgi:hypothetical protein